MGDEAQIPQKALADFEVHAPDLAPSDQVAVANDPEQTILW